MWKKLARKLSGNYHMKPEKSAINHHSGDKSSYGAVKIPHKFYDSLKSEIKIFANGFECAIA